MLILTVYNLLKYVVILPFSLVSNSCFALLIFFF